MKKIITLLLAAGIFCCASAPASALEVKPSGQVSMFFDTFQGYEPKMEAMGLGETNSLIRLLATANFDFIASPSLSARITFETAQARPVWGTSGLTPGGLAGFGVRFAYIDWTVPNTKLKFRMGQQPALSSFGFTGTEVGLFESSTNGNQVTGISFSSPVGNNVNVTGGWFRKKSDSSTVGGEHDMFVVSAPVNFAGINVIPWGGVELIGANAAASGAYRPYNMSLPSSGMGGNGLFYAGGASIKLSMFDPFTIALDAGYTSISYDNETPTVDKSTRAGWTVSAMANYKTNFGVPTLKGWYSSGNSKDTPENEDRRHTSNGPFISGATSFHFPSFIGTNFGGNGANLMNFEQTGSMGASIQWNNLSFVDKLFHNIAVTYVMGTNAPETLDRAYPGSPIPSPSNGTRVASYYMTTDDSVIEFTLQNMYILYKGLMMVVDASYILVNYDEAARKALYPGWEFSDSMRLGVVFHYTF